jgi:hypothetical protein
MSLFSNKKEKVELENHKKWDLLALIWGYNELAKMVETLGEKVYCRMARDFAEQEYIKLGGRLNKEKQDEVILIINGDTFPFIKFREKDIELMRKTVEEFDRKNKNV